MPKSSKTGIEATKKAYNATTRCNEASRRSEQSSGDRRSRPVKAKVGDGTNVDHIKPLKAGGSTKKSNTRVISASKNKGWRGRQPGMYTKKK